MTDPGGERRVELVDSRGCARADVRADYPGQVVGRVVDASGTPIPNLTVELTTTDVYEFPPYQLRAVTDAVGRYTIAGVEPGGYAPGVVIGRTDAGSGPEPLYLFSGGTTTKTAARRLDIEGGSQRNAGDLIVPGHTHRPDHRHRRPCRRAASSGR